MRAIFLVACGAVAATLSATSGNAVSAVADTAVNPCMTAIAADPGKFESGAPFGPGRYVFVLKQPTRFDVTLVGGGGGGGGTPPGADHPLWAAGGLHAGFARSNRPMILPAGQYLIEVGAGGSGGKGWDWRAPPVRGNDGGVTAIRKCPSLNPVVAAPGGAGAPSSGINANWTTPESGGNGEDMVDPDTQERIGKGGRGGQWQQSGESGSGNGAGGGGEGAVTAPDQANGGRGSDGFARIVRVGRT